MVTSMCSSRRGGLVAALLLFASTAPFLAEANAEAVTRQPICGTADLSGLQSRIYVAPAGRDSADCGATPASACASIQHGIDRCAVAGCGVLVRYGLFKTAATIALRDGVGVYGACVFDGNADHQYRTVVEAKPAAGTPAISADSINKPTTVHGLVVIGTKETQPGTASVAMTARNSRGLVIGSTVLSSGAGGPGAPGVSATAAVGPGADGTPSDPANPSGGTPGGRACPSQPTSGGGGGEGAVQRVVNMGGIGLCLHSDSSGGASEGGVPGGAAGTIGSDGIWCPYRPHDKPGDGTDGSPGRPGQAGRRAMASPLVAGTIVETRWQPGKGGDDGAAGLTGSGGGGGGAGGTCMYFSGWDGYLGFAGAGGGGGGCGGTAGTGGQQGGASIVLILSASEIDFVKDSVSIIPGSGGRGGNGGSAVSGGSGGAAGSGVKQGYQHLYWARLCPGHSGNGGVGGPGGAGSGAAAGNGGPSIGIALLGNSPAPPADTPIYPGLPGNGGSHGSGGPAVTARGVTSPAGPDGQDGLAGATAPWLKY